MENCLFFSPKDIVPQLAGSEIHGKGVGARTSAGAALNTGTHHIPNFGQGINDRFRCGCGSLLDFYYLRWVHGFPFLIEDFRLSIIMQKLAPVLSLHSLVREFEPLKTGLSECDFFSKG